jgi:hypothetical protein
MAIRDNNTAANAGAEQENVRAEPAYQNDLKQRRPLSFTSSSLFGAPISRTAGSEKLIGLKKALAKVYENVAGDYAVTLLSVDNVEERDFAFSFIIVALQRKSTGGRSGVAYHTLLVEATGDKVTPYTVQEGNSQIQVLRTTGDAYNEILVRRAANAIANAFPDAAWHRAVDATVVPRTFNYEDPTAVHMLALSAGMACGTELELAAEDFGDLSLATIARDQSIEINVGFNRGQLADAVGEPMRADVLVNLALRRQGNNNGQKNVLNSKDGDVKVAELAGFIDLVWAPVPGAGVVNPYVQQVMTPTQKYAARLVITNMASNSAYTPASMLLSLISAVSLRDDNNWIQAFRPQPLTSGIDLRDIGALNIEAGLGAEPGQPGQRIDTKAENFRLEDLGQLVSALVQPGLIISFDVPECGPQTWYSSLFAAAANGSKAAYDILYQAAQDLTNGNFGKYFRPGEEMFTDKHNRVHLGYWNDGNTRRDIREIDYTAVANLGGERDPAVIRDWSDTFTRTDFSQNLRLASREKMITAFTRETAEFTGFAQRVTFTMQFIDALVRGARDAGFSPSVKTPLTASDFNNARGVANFVGAALVQPGAAYYNASAGFVPGQAAFAGGGYYRY